jgi:hypothetical protein
VDDHTKSKWILCFLLGMIRCPVFLRRRRPGTATELHDKQQVQGARAPSFKRRPASARVAAARGQSSRCSRADQAMQRHVCRIRERKAVHLRRARPPTCKERVVRMPENTHTHTALPPAKAPTFYMHRRPMSGGTTRASRLATPSGPRPSTARSVRVQIQATHPDVAARTASTRRFRARIVKAQVSVRPKTAQPLQLSQRSSREHSQTRPVTALYGAPCHAQRVEKHHLVLVPPTKGGLTLASQSEQAACGFTAIPADCALLIVEFLHVTDIFGSLVRVSRQWAGLLTSFDAVPLWNAYAARIGTAATHLTRDARELSVASSHADVARHAQDIQHSLHDVTVEHLRMFTETCGNVNVSSSVQHMVRAFVHIMECRATRDDQDHRGLSSRAVAVLPHPHPRRSRQKKQRRRLQSARGVREKQDDIGAQRTKSFAYSLSRLVGTQGPSWWVHEVLSEADPQSIAGEQVLSEADAWQYESIPDISALFVGNSTATWVAVKVYTWLRSAVRFCLAARRHGIPSQLLQAYGSVVWSGAALERRRYLSPKTISSLLKDVQCGLMRHSRLGKSAVTAAVAPAELQTAIHSQPCKPEAPLPAQQSVTRTSVVQRPASATRVYSDSMMFWAHDLLVSEDLSVSLNQYSANDPRRSERSRIGRDESVL